MVLYFTHNHKWLFFILILKTNGFTLRIITFRKPIYLRRRLEKSEGSRPSSGC